jgi:hypothetical protein
MDRLSDEIEDLIDQLIVCEHMSDDRKAEILKIVAAIALEEE